jgi:tRNA-dihydrouridine synthase B
MVVSEMVTSDMSLWNSRKSSLRRIHEGDPEPRSVQIAGGDAQMMAAAARANVEAAPRSSTSTWAARQKVCNKAAGSALLRDEALVSEILHAVVGAVDVPVTLKIRTGWDRANKNGLNVAKIAEQAGIQALAVHGRTRADLYTGEAEYDTIAAIKQAVSIPVLPTAISLARKGPGGAGRHRGRWPADWPGCPGAAMDLSRDRALPAHRRTPAGAALDEVERILLEHLAALHAFYGDVMGVRIARKHVGWYLATDLAARSFAPGSTLWKTHKRSAPTFARFRERRQSLETEDGQGVAA